MQNSIAFTPPDRSLAGSAPVRRRFVFYVPGYDPEARTRYRKLFVRELLRHAQRTGMPRPEVSSATVDADGLSLGWTVEACGGARLSYELLLWDDIVARDCRRPRLLSLALLTAGTIHTVATGLMVTFFRMNWKYGCVIIYPIVLSVVLVLLSWLLADAVHAHLGDRFGHSLGWPLWATLPLGLAAALAWVRLIERFLHRIFFWLLVNDWVFNWQHGLGRRPDYVARLQAFSAHVEGRLATLAPGPDDEVLIVGHSSGGLAAAEIAATLLERGVLDRPGSPPLSLLTLGSCLPLVALQGRARHVREQIARLVTTERIDWVDYGAPQDPINFPGFNPVTALDLGLAPGARITNPFVRSARFRDIIDPAVYARVHYRPFRMHFQFLMANDRPGAYDFFAFVLGPQRLADRVMIWDGAPPSCEGRVPSLEEMH